MSKKIKITTIPSWGYCVHKSFIQGVHCRKASELNYEGCGEYEFNSETTIAEMLKTLHESHSVECPGGRAGAYIIFIQEKLNEDQLPEHCPDGEDEDIYMDPEGEIKCRMQPSDKFITELCKGNELVIYTHALIVSAGHGKGCCVS